jgi:hypothetical protein
VFVQLSPCPDDVPGDLGCGGAVLQHLQNFCTDPTACQILAHDFLQATMVPDVMDGELSGVEELLDSWARLSVCFDNIHLGVSAPDSGMLVAKTTTSVTFSESSFRCAFPQLSKGEKSGSGRHARPRIAGSASGHAWVCTLLLRQRNQPSCSNAELTRHAARYTGHVSRVFENALKGNSEKRIVYFEVAT